MKRVIVSLLIVSAVTGSAAARPPSNAPKELFAADTGEEVRAQTGRLIMSTWEGEEYDRSFPPIKWPVSLPVTSDSETSITIATQEPPDVVEIRVWHKLRGNGIPKGEPVLITCAMPVIAAGTECTLEPEVGPSGISWRATFELPWKDGYRFDHHYVAVLANWDDAQVAWINHIIRAYYTEEAQ